MDRPFNRYFILFEENFEISHVKFKEIINITEYEKIKKIILNLNEEQKTQDFIEKLKSNAENIPKTNIKLFIRLLFDIGDLLNFKNEDFIHDKDYLMSRCINNLLKTVKPDHEKFELMKYSIEKSEDSIYTIINEISNQNQIHCRNRFKNYTKNKYNLKFSNGELDILEEITSKKICEWIKNDKLFNHEDFRKIIREWTDWKNNNAINNFINDTYNNDELLIKLLKSITLKNLNSKTKIRLDFNLLNKIFDIKILYGRIIELKEIYKNNEEINNLCESFILQFEEKQCQKDILIT